MEFSEAIFNHIKPYIVLIPVPIVIFSATPRMPSWYKSGRILFLWLIVAVISGIGLYSVLSDPATYERWWVKEHAYKHHIFLSIWGCFLVNVYIGWWEFLWRCVYRQWSWPPLKNLKYGWVSNICILGFASFAIPLATLLSFVGIYKYFSY